MTKPDDDAMARAQAVCLEWEGRVKGLVQDHRDYLYLKSLRDRPGGVLLTREERERLAHLESVWKDAPAPTSLAEIIAREIRAAKERERQRWDAMVERVGLCPRCLNAEQKR